MSDGRLIAIAPDAPELRQALVDARLPTADLDETPGHFYAFEESGRTIGYGGFEAYGADGLLRSVVILPQARGGGAGTRLTAALLSAMRSRGIGTAYLLTTDAAAFFARAGFVATARAHAPSSIMATRQATTICSTATLLSRPT